MASCTEILQFQQKPSLDVVTNEQRSGLPTVSNHGLFVLLDVSASSVDDFVVLVLSCFVASCS